MVSALLGGLRAGLTATLLSALVANWLWIGRERSDVVIVDVGMPRDEGYLDTAAPRPGARSAEPRLPAIALAAFAGAADRERAVSASYDEHLSGPVSPANMARAVARLGSPS